jgi:hypothetical protein
MNSFDNAQTTHTAVNAVNVTPLPPGLESPQIPGELVFA